MKLTPKMVSGRVVKISNFRSGLSRRTSHLLLVNDRSSYVGCLSRSRTNQCCQARQAIFGHRRKPAMTIDASSFVPRDNLREEIILPLPRHLPARFPVGDTSLPWCQPGRQDGSSVIFLVVLSYSLFFHSSAVKSISSPQATFNPWVPTASNAFTSSVIGMAFCSS